MGSTVWGFRMMRYTVLVVAGLAVGASLTAGAQYVSFQDDNLEQAVLEALGKESGPIEEFEMLALTVLDASGRAIFHLNGLEYATNLITLNLDANEIGDLTPLAALPSLADLSLRENNLYDVSPLSGVTSLTGLDLSFNYLSDVAPLAGLVNLWGLALGSNNITDVAPLAGLTNLTELQLWQNDTSDISPLAALTNLTSLALADNGIGNLAPLAGLTDLAYLYLSTNAIVDLGPLAGLTNLVHLDLRDNSIGDLTALSGLISLITLDLSWNVIMDVEPLVANTGLGAGDVLKLDANPLNQNALCNQLPLLEGRGFAMLTYDGACDSGTLQVTPTEILAGAPAGSFDFAVSLTSGEAPWVATVISGGDWLSIAPDFGVTPDTITAMYTENATGDTRVGQFQVSADLLGQTVTVTVSQAPWGPPSGPTLSIGAPSRALTNTGPVSFAVQYQDATAVNLSAADVTLIATGTAGGAVSVADGTTLSPTVTVHTITGDGALAIGIRPGTAVDEAFNEAPGAGPSEAFNVDNTPPTVTILGPSPALTASGPVEYSIRYSGANIVLLTAQDILVHATGTAAGRVGVAHGTTVLPVVTLSDITGRGALAISVRPDTARDAAGNLAPGAGPSEPVSVQDAEVVFEDPRLESAVREALGLTAGPISMDDLARLVRLDAAGRGIHALGGLEHAAGLRSLDLSYNRLTGVGALVANAAFADGASLRLYGNPLAQDTLCTELPALEGRGVTVAFNGTCGVVASGRIFGFIYEAAPPHEAIECAAVLVSEGRDVVGVAIADSRGYYEISRLRQGTAYSLHFAAPGYSTVLREHTLSSEEDDVSVLLEVGASARLSGFVSDDTPARRGVPGALVVAQHQDREIGRTITCASGAFSFETLDLPKAASATLDISAPGYLAQSVAVDPDSQDVIETTLPKLLLPGSILGTVTNPAGGAISNAEVIVQQAPAGFSAVRTTAPDGSYAVANVPDGDYEARAALKNVGWGLNAGAVNQDLAQIDIELVHGEAPCIPPAPPTGLAASDGADTGGVMVTWDPVAGMDIEYQVLRSTTAGAHSAAAVSGWITGTSFRDTSAAPPKTSTGGCNGGTTVTYTTYYYWVRCRAAGAACASPLSTSDTGYRGAVNKEIDRAGGGFEPGLLAFLAASALLVLLPGRNRNTLCEQNPQ
jgi:Leucine-rich repeat (LRR) protein